jgi:hypothetical protein
VRAHSGAGDGAGAPPRERARELHTRQPLHAR